MKPEFPINLCHKITPEKLQKYWDQVESELQAVCAELELELEEDVEPQFVYFGEDTKRFGNHGGKPTTIIHYEKIFRQFWNFLSYRGGYEEMLMLLPDPPRGCPPMRPTLLEQFLDFKLKPTNTPLGFEDTFGNEMLSEGGWNAPKKEWAFTAAISELHAYHGFRQVKYVSPV